LRCRRFSTASDEGGELTVHNPAEIEGFYRYPDLTAQCEFLALMIDRTIKQAIPQELHFLQKFEWPKYAESGAKNVGRQWRYS